jgi:hypothetical protein
MPSRTLRATISPRKRGNRLLLPPGPPMQAITHAAEHNPVIAKHFVECFDDPPQFFPWLFDMAAAERLFGPLQQAA